MPLSAARAPLRFWIIFVLHAIAGLFPAVAQQRPPALHRDLPGPARNHIEVRFAFGQESVTCKRFYLSARHDGKSLFSGWFVGGFAIPEAAKRLPERQKLELTFSCGGHHWHFTHAAERAFLWGYWWVGTDFPPFQESLQGDQFKNVAWARYLMVDPSASPGYWEVRACFYKPIPIYGLCMPD